MIKIVIGLEVTAERTLTENIDTTRTVGWFTNLYPLLLDIILSKRYFPDSIKSIKVTAASVVRIKDWATEY
jgi:hypothetical protein